MNLLAIDTATEACSVALSGIGDAILERFKIESGGHSNLVLPMVDDVLVEAGISRTDLDGIAYDSGPGSFTGIRIGLSVAQGFALAFDLPLLGVSSLMALAEGSRDRYSPGAVGKGTLRHPGPLKRKNGALAND